MTHIVVATNKAARIYYISKKVKEYTQSRPWYPFNIGEILVYFGLHVFMGLIQISQRELYWVVNTGYLFPKVRKAMLLVRFEQINQFFCIYYPGKKTYVFEKLSPIIEALQAACKAYWLPGVNIAVDESIARFKGRAYETIIIPNKPIKTGFKVWMVANIGYILHWIYHQKGKGPWNCILVKGLNLTASVVVRILDILPKDIKLGSNPRYHVFLDNLFVSYKLLIELCCRNIRATGTARSNLGVIKDLLELKLMDKKENTMPWGTLHIRYTLNHQVAQFLLKDNS